MCCVNLLPFMALLLRNFGGPFYVKGNKKRERETERQKHSTTFQSISGFALPFLRHSNSPLL